MGDPCDFSVSPSPFGLDFGSLDFGTLDLGLTISDHTDEYFASFYTKSLISTFSLAMSGFNFVS